MAISSEWAWLPKELLDLILDKVASPFDKVRFGAVCKSWGIAVKERRRLKTQVAQTPMLLIPSKDNIKKTRSLYRITDRKISGVKLPMPHNRRCCGSSFGWLSYVTEASFITLFNPFRNAKIHLPQLQKLRGYRRYGNKYEYTVKKVTLSSDPASTPEDCLAMALFGEFTDLAFVKLGDESWTYVEEDRMSVYADVLYFKGGQFLVIDHRSGLVSIDVNTNQKKILAPADLDYTDRTYLVETSGGNLLLVRRLIDSFPFGLSCQGMTSCFEVYKLVLDDESGKVVERVKVKNIGDDVLFLGDNQSISVSAFHFPGCHPNSIYYTDDYIDTKPYYPNGPIDMGIFNLEDGTIRPHYKPDPAHKHKSPPIWILPSML
ncbi:F-box protein SKIP23-like [Alnus glutinosa]|uniref:F-box protein SKIP23-like n=1 Tax=Alnus glutinosa TaxID=3517 RepID=UPI002D79B7B3|nr:F-box protein SKIP23-like [Alnus glutinosa]